MEYITIYRNKKIKRNITDASIPSLGGLVAFFDDMWFWQPDQMEQDIQKGERSWNGNSSCVDVLENGNFKVYWQGYVNPKNHLENFFTVSRPALYDFMEKWKKIDQDAYEKIIITYDGTTFEIKTYEKMTLEEENDAMWVERFK